jgi:predicted metal-dependent phosphoesterase TrpH
MRADLHCHSTASQRSKLGVQRALGLPECATPPQEVLDLALARGMDFMTITDHDTIDGVLEIAGDPRVFISVELTCWFREEPQAVHVLCLGITPMQFADLQAMSNCAWSRSPSTCTSTRSPARSRIPSTPSRRR